MPPPPNSSPGSDFMADFYAEADDHLVEIRRGLLKLEEQLGQMAMDDDFLQKVFRSFHSLKGICGMAGLHAAEQLSHRAEDFLRALSREEAILTEEGINVLTSVAQKLEELIVRHRERQAPSETTSLLERLSSLAGGRPAEPHANDLREVSATGYAPQMLRRVEAARQEGRKVLRCLFRPAPDLDRRGINLASVRAQLQTLGEILQAAPKVQPGGELMFEFLIAFRG